MKRYILLACLLTFFVVTNTAEAQFDWLKPKDKPAQSPEQIQQHAQWWNANRHLAKYVEGRGYQVPGAAGFFDASGRPLSDNAGPIVGSLQRDDDDEGIPINGNFASSLWNRVNGRESSSTTPPPSSTKPYQPITYARPAGTPDVTPEQARWWAENRRFSHPIGNGVHQIDGHGIFDDRGRRLGPSPALATPRVPNPNAGQPPYPNVPPRDLSGDPNTNPYGDPNAALPSYRRGGDNVLDTLNDSYASTEEKEDGFLDMLPKSLTGGKNVDQNEARQKFAQADEAMRRRDYDAALEGYTSAMEAWPNSPLEEDAMFMIGESHFFMDAYPDAFDAYEELLKKYKRSRHLEKVVTREFQIGQYWLQHHEQDPSWAFTPNFTDKTRPLRDTLGFSRKVFSRVRLNDPTGKLADDSLMATANSHFTRGDWENAAYHYTLLVREYPDSEHQYNAHLFGIQAHLRVYQGPEYDKAPLDEAEQLMKQVRRQFAQQSPEDRQRLQTVEAQINLARAQRDFHTAEFYERQEFADAARQYYQQIVEDYPNTPVAQRAHAKMAELHNEPGIPPPRFGWISAVFPEERNEMTNMIRTARAPREGPVRR